jgi:hypothetical protein
MSARPAPRATDSKARKTAPSARPCPRDLRRSERSEHHTCRKSPHRSRDHATWLAHETRSSTLQSSTAAPAPRLRASVATQHDGHATFAQKRRRPACLYAWRGCPNQRSLVLAQGRLQALETGATFFPYKSTFLPGRLLRNEQTITHNFPSTSEASAATYRRLSLIRGIGGVSNGSVRENRQSLPHHDALTTCTLTPRLASAASMSPARKRAADSSAFRCASMWARPSPRTNAYA